MTHFDFVLYYKLGKMMQAEDLLSRRANYEIGIDLNNTNQVLLKPKFFAINVLEATHELPINNCHDLAKQLSQYLYFFSFLLDYY